MQDETNIPSEEILDTEVPAEVVTPSFGVCKTSDGGKKTDLYWNAK